MPIISKVYNFVEMYIQYIYKSILIGISKLLLAKVSENKTFFFVT